ncbi:transposase family protein [Patescibacteria group bacterium]|nr:transposase family protein [Patescibacteria group bacterium]MBU1885516.1 transposase family protein [Patescibacteria group bacterium]
MLLCDYTPNLVKIVKQIKDERQQRGQRYTTEVIIWILILGVLLGGENLVSIYELFVYKKKLRKIIYKLIGKKLNKIPHPTTISRALKKISLEGLIEGLSLDQLGEELEDELYVAGDGKVMRGIHNGRLLPLQTSTLKIYQKVLKV